MVASVKKVGIVILAAGASQRLGEPKQLLRFAGTSLICHAVAEACATQAAHVVCVLGAFAEAIEAELRRCAWQAERVEIVRNAHWQEGMAASIREGIKALQMHDSDAALIMLCDQPFIERGFLNRLINRWHETNAPIVASGYADAVGVPALFAKECWSELLKLQGESGAQRLIRQHPHKVVPCQHGMVDIDTPEDKARLQAFEASQSRRS